MPSFLLLDADRNFRATLEIALRVEGAAVLASGAVGEAEALLRQATFDVVAIDSTLAGADALLARLAADRRVVVATGHHRELLDRAARRFGVPTLEKPFGVSALVALARRSDVAA